MYILSHKKRNDGLLRNRINHTPFGTIRQIARRIKQWSTLYSENGAQSSDTSAQVAAISAKYPKYERKYGIELFLNTFLYIRYGSNEIMIRMLAVVPSSTPVTPRPQGPMRAYEINTLKIAEKRWRYLTSQWRPQATRYLYTAPFSPSSR